MIIKSFELDKLKSYKSNIHLIYGNNEGIKEDIINNYYLKNFEGEILKYDEQDILINKDEFISSLLNQSLFETNKLIIISRSTDKIFALVSAILEKENFETKIIIKSTTLDKKSKIRKLFEKEQQLICTPVYEDDSRSLNIVIQNFLRENKLNLSQEIKNILIERSKGDRINLKNELTKIKNLMISKNKLSTEDVLKLSRVPENYSVFELSDNYLVKNSRKVSNILNENNYSSEDCILIIRTILSKLKRLLKIRAEIDNDVNIDQVISNYRPAIFWKENGFFEEINIKNGYEANGLGTGAAVADIDDDGILELLIAHGESGMQPLTMYKADIKKDFKYLRIKPLNKFGAPARGATVILKSNLRNHAKTIDAGSGYLCQMEPVAHYGIRDGEKNISIKIIWTNGFTETLNINDINRTIEVTQK